MIMLIYDIRLLWYDQCMLVYYTILYKICSPNKTAEPLKQSEDREFTKERETKTGVTHNMSPFTFHLNRLPLDIVRVTLGFQS